MERPPFISETPGATLAARESVTGGDEAVQNSRRAQLLRLRDGEWEERRCGEALWLLHRVNFYAARRDVTLKIVWQFLCGACSCSTAASRPFSESGKSWVWLAFDCSDGEDGRTVEGEMGLSGNR